MTIDFDSIRKQYSLPDVVSRDFTLRPRGREWVGCCPFHRDTTPSLSLYNKGNIWRFVCFVCGSKGDVLDYIAMSRNVDVVEAAGILTGEDYRAPQFKAHEGKLPPDPYIDLRPVTPIPDDVPDLVAGQKFSAWNAKQGKFSDLRPSMIFPYRNPEGALLGYVVRQDFVKDGKKQKWTPTIQWCERKGAAAGWCLMAFDPRRPLYGLDLLAKAPEGSQVILVEGEKSADALRGMYRKIIPMTWPGGTNGVNHADWSPLMGRDVIFWPDADQPGIRAAGDAVRALEGIASGLRVMDADPEGGGWDAADARYVNGWSAAQIKDYIVSKIKPLKAAELPAKAEGRVSLNWEDSLIMKNDKGQVDSRSQENLRVVLTQSPLFRGMFVYDEFHGLTMVRRRPPWEKDESFEVRPLRDTDFTHVRCLLERGQFGDPPLPNFNKDMALKIGINDIRAAIDTAADTCKIHPARDHLDSLVWDGTKRLDTWLRTYLGAEAQSDEYLKLVGVKWLVAAVTRLYRPGTKFDCMLVLEGRQGSGKSTALRTLATFGRDEPREYFTDSVSFSKIGERDTIMMLQGRVIVEMSELSGFGRREEEEIKHWIAKQADECVLKWKNETKSFPRQFILAGTTNKYDSWLKDETGNRRFWPVRVADVIDLEKLDAAREQLWAEAVAVYKAGHEVRVLDRAEQQIIEDEQHKRLEVDIWHDMIRDHLAQKTFITTAEILRDCLKVEVKDMDQFRNGRRVAKILRGLEWEACKHRPEGSTKVISGWRPIPPPKPKEEEIPLD